MVKSPDLEAATPTRKFRWQQYLAALLATLAAVCDGTVMGWSAPVLPVLQNKTADPLQGSFAMEKPLTDAQASWVVSLLPLGGLIGALPSGYIADCIGRRRSLLFFGVLLLVGWIILLVDLQSASMLYLSRLVLGVAAGGVTVVTPLYNEEIADDDIRGALGTYLDLMLAVGILWSYVFGAFLPVFWFTVLTCLLPIVFCASFYWMPESPVYLESKGRLAEAAQAYNWFHGLPLRELPIAMKPPVEKQVSTDEALNMAVAVRACVAAFGLMSFQQLSGIDAILFYTTNIYEDSGSSIDPLLATVITGVVQAVATYASSLLVDRTGRRVLLIGSGVAMAGSHAVLACYLGAREAGMDMSVVGWVPLLALNMFLVFFALSLGPLPWFMMAELLPDSCKSWASGTAVCLNWLLSFVVAKWFFDMLDALGGVATYSVFFAICVIYVVFVVFFVPETKCKSREEIHQELAEGIPIKLLSKFRSS